MQRRWGKRGNLIDRFAQVFNDEIGVKFSTPLDDFAPYFLVLICEIEVGCSETSRAFASAVATTAQKNDWKKIMEDELGLGHHISIRWYLWWEIGKSWRQKGVLFQFFRVFRKKRMITKNKVLISVQKPQTMDFKSLESLKSRHIKCGAS